MDSRLFYRLKFYLVGFVLAILLATPSLASEWGISPLTGKPQGFCDQCSPPVGDFGPGANIRSTVIIDDGPVIHDYRTAPEQLIENNVPAPPDQLPKLEGPFPDDFGKPIIDEHAVEFKKSWDDWHKRVAALIYERFNQSAQKLFKHSPQFSCQVSYMIARDGRVGQVRVLQPSTNPVYDAMLLTTIKSMAHDPILVFPQGSNRQFIEKSGTFTWNLGSHGPFGRNSVGNFDDEPLRYWGPNHGSQGLVPQDK